MIKYLVRIIENDNNCVIKEIEVDSLRRAEMTENGMNINLNHKCFHTVIVEKS